MQISKGKIILTIRGARERHENGSFSQQGFDNLTWLAPTPQHIISWLVKVGLVLKLSYEHDPNGKKGRKEEVTKDLRETLSCLCAKKRRKWGKCAMCRRRVVGMGL